MAGLSTLCGWAPPGLYRLKTPEQGAATSVLVATSPQLEGIGGRYFEDCNEAAVVDPSGSAFVGSGVAAYAQPRQRPAPLGRVAAPARGPMRTLPVGRQGSVTSEGSQKIT